MRGNWRASENGATTRKTMPTAPHSRCRLRSGYVPSESIDGRFDPMRNQCVTNAFSVIAICCLPTTRSAGKLWRRLSRPLHSNATAQLVRLLTLAESIFYPCLRLSGSSNLFRKSLAPRRQTVIRCVEVGCPGRQRRRPGNPRWVG